jgi:hypothetical protein
VSGQRGKPFVYFIRPVGMRGPVKIGYSTLPERRLMELSVWSPFPLEVACRIPGSNSTELAFHTLFRAFHSHNEWFHPAPEIDATIDAINAGSFELATLPKGRRLCVEAWTAEKRQRIGYLAALGTSEWRTGLFVPAGVREAAQRLDAIAGRARDADLAAVKAYLADPLGNGGEEKPYTWAQERLAAYRLKRAA